MEFRAPRFSEATNFRVYTHLSSGKIMNTNTAHVRLLIVIFTLLFGIGSASADQQADEFMNSTWRAYRTMPSSSVVINTRTYGEDDSVVGFARFIVFWSARGGIRVNSPSCTWVHDGGKAYGSNGYFPGCFQSKVVGSNSGKAFEVLNQMWPGVELPLDVRIRMANSWEEAFAVQLEQVGPDGKVSIATTAWKEGLPSTVLRFASSDGAYEENIWFNSVTGDIYGRVRRIRTDGVDQCVGSQSLTEVTAAADKQIRFATASREEFSNFEELSNTFTKNFSIPTPETLEADSASGKVSPTR